MFTIEQIKTAHSKVKSGGDFPAYIQEIGELGVTGYEISVTDGHSIYYGQNEYRIESPARYAKLGIADSSDVYQFQKNLKEHQQGKSDYLTFVSMSAQLGIEKWIVDISQMTCTYYDKSGNEILIETIPSP
jgi:uncharacterized protein YbcV (DUF1398 family)